MYGEATIPKGYMVDIDTSHGRTKKIASETDSAFYADIPVTVIGKQRRQKRENATTQEFKQETCLQALPGCLLVAVLFLFLLTCF